MHWKVGGVGARVIALVAVAAVLVAGFAYVAMRPRTEEAPLFILPVVGAGNATVDLSAMRGKVVVLDLMAVNCAACRTLTKGVLHPLWDENANRTDFALWSVDVWAGLPGQAGESAADLAQLQADEGSPWPHALDNGTVYGAYKPYALPELLVLDTDGRIVFQAGAPDLPSLASVRAAVASAKTRGTDAVGIPQGGLATLAILAGAAAVFSPCSVGLLPAYFGMLLRGRTARPGPVLGGLQTAAGVVLVYGAIAALLLPFGNVIMPLVPKLGIAMGAVFVVLGVMMLGGFDWGRLTNRFRGRMRAPDGGNRGYWAFGLGYAIASFGCTGPIFVPLILSSFASGPVVGLGIFVLYAAGVAVLLVLVALLAALGADGPLRWLTANSRWVARVVAVAWIGSGLYLLWYDLRAYA